MQKGGGQSRALSSFVKANTANADTKCAIAIQAIWKAVNGKLPGLQSTPLHQACSALWHAAGGRGAKEAGWRTDLQEARKKRYRREAEILVQQIGVQGIHPEKP